MNLTGKVIAVTGGGAGIGRATVLGLLSRGARVAAIDLNPDGLKETADLAAADKRLTLHPLNITDREDVLALPDSILEQHGQVDGLVNIAGVIQPFVHIKDLDFAKMEQVMDVNFWGTVNTVKAFLPQLLTRPEASLVNVSSMGAILPVPGQSVYGASKAAVSLLTEGLYAELQDSEVHVTEVFPGAVGTEITKNSGVTRTGDSNESSTRKITSPETAAEKIIEAMEKRRFRVHIGNDAKLFDALSRLIPQRAIGMIAKKMKDIV
ncbi:SDR family oxidoreductase [Nesterenkonia salmonea]|uniref:SDR family oxidoreductase n=1 Tax=Nesterenkonia salmonea TaxID=1804987 RepID=A0A5R9BLE5_9MICC|nr:SDR family oxidoreductase [Nesterenkonia salmonea]TLQ01447.1 SDR family oxidoreductase [Nesterenkonia salmonea]